MGKNKFLAQDFLISMSWLYLPQCVSMLPNILYIIFKLSSLTHEASIVVIQLPPTSECTYFESK